MPRGLSSPPPEQYRTHLIAGVDGALRNNFCLRFTQTQVSNHSAARALAEQSELCEGVPPQAAVLLQILREKILVLPTKDAAQPADEHIDAKDMFIEA